MNDGSFAVALKLALWANSVVQPEWIQVEPDFVQVDTAWDPSNHTASPG